MNLKTEAILLLSYYFFSLVTTTPIVNGPTPKMNTASNSESGLLPKRQDANGGFTHISSGLDDLSSNDQFQDFLNWMLQKNDR